MPIDENLGRQLDAAVSHLPQAEREEAMRHFLEGRSEETRGVLQHLFPAATPHAPRTPQTPRTPETPQARTPETREPQTTHQEPQRTETRREEPAHRQEHVLRKGEDEPVKGGFIRKTGRTVGTAAALATGTALGALGTGLWSLPQSAFTMNLLKPAALWSLANPHLVPAAIGSVAALGGLWGLGRLREYMQKEKFYKHNHNGHFPKKTFWQNVWGGVTAPIAATQWALDKGFNVAGKVLSAVPRSAKWLWDNKLYAGAGAGLTALVLLGVPSATIATAGWPITVGAIAGWTLAGIKQAAQSQHPTSSLALHTP